MRAPVRRCRSAAAMPRDGGGCRRDGVPAGGDAMSPDSQGSPPPDDWAERWGRRIGRGLAVLACLVLAYHFIATYLR